MSTTMLEKILSSTRKLLNNRVLQNILIVGGVTLFIKVVGFFKEAMVASRFGLSESLDTFFIAILVPGFISNVFLGAFKSAFVPNYIAEMRQPTGDRSSFFQVTTLRITP